MFGKYTEIQKQLEQRTKENEGFAQILQDVQNQLKNKQELIDSLEQDFEQEKQKKLKFLRKCQELQDRLNDQEEQTYKMKSSARVIEQRLGKIQNTLKDTRLED